MLQNTLLCVDSSEFLNCTQRFQLLTAPRVALLLYDRFKIYLGGATKGSPYWDLVYGGGDDSLCRYANMTECVIDGP